VKRFYIIIITLLFIPTFVYAVPKIGAFVPSDFDDMTQYNQLEQQLGRKLDGYLTYVASSEPTYWPNVKKRIEGPIAQGKIVQVGFETKSWQGTSDPAIYSLKAIAGGSIDSQLIAWADYLKSQNYPILLRPMSEMNLNWDIWAGTYSPNQPADYAPAFRHLVDVFRARGATNVKFIWAVNYETIPNTPENDIANYWPGAEYVDYIGIDGYDPEGNKSFDQVFGQLYKRLTTEEPFLSSGKNIIICETASVEPNKPKYISDLFYYALHKFPKIEQIYWFNAKKERDWRLETTPGSINTFITNWNTPPKKDTVVCDDINAYNYSPLITREIDNSTCIKNKVHTKWF
jgi:hypothetical protein